MKKIQLIIVTVLLAVIAVILGIYLYNQNDSNENVPESDLITDLNDQYTSDVEESDSMRIRLSFNNQEAYVQLNDSKSSQDFISLLPLTLDFEDYNSTEKISYLPRELTTEGAPSGYTPEVGDFSYYAPWGNLSIFYREFRYSNSLVKLGEFESGIEELGSMTGNFEMTIELVD